MKIKHRILIIHCAKWFAAFMSLYYLILAIVTITSATSPGNSFFNKVGSTLFEQADYRKGVPLQIDPVCIAPYPFIALDKNSAGRPVMRTIPFFEGLKKQYFRRPLSSGYYDSMRAEGRVVDVYCDSAGVVYYASILSTDPAIKDAPKQEFTMRIRPSHAGKSLQLFLPEILRALFFSLSLFFIYRVLRNWLNGKLEHYRIFGVLAPIGILLTSYHLLMLLIGFTAAYSNAYYIDFNTPVTEFNVPMEIYGHPANPFSIMYLLVGLGTFTVGLAIRYAEVKEPDFSESLEEMAEA